MTRMHVRSIAPRSDSLYGTFTLASITGTGQTTYVVSTNSVSIIIADSRCEAQTDPLSIYNTILHESLHAQMGLELMEKGLDPYEIQAYSDSELRDSYIVNFYIESRPDISIDDLQHGILLYAEDVVGQLSMALMSLNDQQGTPEHYRLLAWNGLIDYARSYSQDVVGPQNYFVNLDQIRQSNFPYSFPCSN